MLTYGHAARNTWNRRSQFLKGTCIMFEPKEALILVLELAEQAALDPKHIENDPMLQEIADAQQEAIMVVYEEILDKL